MPQLTGEFVEFKTDDSSAPGCWEGYVSVFGNVDKGNDITAKGAFLASIKEAKKNGMPPTTWSHGELIGDVHELREDAKGLFAKGQLWVGKGIQDVERAYAWAKGTSRKGMSFGYRASLYEIDQKTGVRTLKKVDLLEVAFTSFPMNPSAGLLGMKHDDGTFDVGALERALRDAGLTRSEAKAILHSGVSGLREADLEAASLAKEIRAIAASIVGHR